jgi:uncharacterized protein YcaQ
MARSLGYHPPVPTPRPVGADVARRFFVLRHLLAPPRSLQPKPASVMAVMERLGSIQFDPLGIAGRNHDLVLQARIAGYRVSWTDDLLYRERRLFESFNKMLSLLPTERLPYHRQQWDRVRHYHERETFPKHGETAERILARLRQEGPLSSQDFEVGKSIDWYWRPTNEIRAMLEALWESGTIAISHRVGNRRYYDLTERVHPPDVLAVRVPEHEQLRQILLSRYRGHGLLSSVGSPELWYGVRRATGPRADRGAFRAELLAELLADGLLVPVHVEDIRGIRYVLSEELPLLEQAEREVAAGTPPGGSAPGVSFLAPLDSFVWDRNLLRSLFDFDYVWEVYVPAAKRRWGYYVLPLLFGDSIVGRIEPRIERDASGRKVVRVIGLWWEKGFRPRQVEGFVPAMRAALTAYRRFAHARQVEWPSALRAAGRLFGSGRARG